MNVFAARSALSCALAITLSLAVSGFVHAQQVVYVDASLATGSNDGSSWEHAFQGRLGLQAALTSLPAGGAFEIWLADGTYAPAGADGGRDSHFAMRNELAILGGFAGGEASRDERDPLVNLAILTGDLNSNDTPGEVGTWLNLADNATNVVRALGVEATSVLDGVTIVHGAASEIGAVNDEGGGLRIEGGEPVIRQCVFEFNVASSSGGGIAMLASGAAIRDCVLRSNRGGHRGGGVFQTDGSTGVFERCTFSGNAASLGSGLFTGLGAPCSALVRDCVFRDHVPVLGGGSGLGIFDDNGELVVERCSFLDNITVGGGAGVYLFQSSAIVRDCDFVGNEALGDGGAAIYAQATPFVGMKGRPRHITFVNCRFVGNNGVMVVIGGLVDMINCTIAHNGLQDPFGIWPVVFVQGETAHARFRNSIITGNGVGPFAEFENAVVGGVGVSIIDGVISMDSCCVQGWDQSVPGADSFEANPMFVDALGADGVAGTMDDDVHLLAGSPCIDAGENAFVPGFVAGDFDAQPRIVDGDSDIGAIVDIGAFEFQPTLRCLGDMVASTFLPPGDGAVDGFDLAFLLGEWGRTRGSLADMVGDDFTPPPDGNVDGFDLAVLLGAWGACR